MAFRDLYDQSKCGEGVVNSPPGSPKFVTNQEEKSFKSPPFVFLPGHRFLIAKFIDDVKARHTLNSKLSRKRPTVIDTVNNSSPSYTAAKKVKTVCTTAEEPTGNRYNLEHISDDIRKRIVEWQRKHNSPEIKRLQEHTDYKLECKLNSTGNLEVDVWCRFCNKKHLLSQKEDKSGNTVAMLSNWTGHVPKCVENLINFRCLKKASNQQLLLNFN